MLITNTNTTIDLMRLHFEHILVFGSYKNKIDYHLIDKTNSMMNL